MSKKTLYWTGVILLFYFAISLVKFSFTPFSTHPDGYWYHSVARNWARGKGYTDNIVYYFYPQPGSIIHPASTIWNPLSYMVLGLSYRAFGDTHIKFPWHMPIEDTDFNFAGRLPVFVTDAIIALVLFGFCLRIFKDYGIAVLSSLTFITHKAVITMRAAGGAAESFHSFFVTLLCLALALSFNNNWFFCVSGVLAGLAYLVRNESLWGLPVIAVIFLYKKFYSDDTAEKPSWNILAISFALFLAVILPWEIRNHIVYGSSANAAKYALIFGRNYYDIWSCSLPQNGLLSSIKYHLGMGWKQLCVVKLQSYYYKLDTCALTLSWPIILLLLTGLARNLREKAFFPVYAYFLCTYVLTGFFNSISQGAGWHAPGNLIPLIIPLAFSGGFYFGDLVTKNAKKARLAGYLLCIFVFMYHLGDNYKQYRIQEKAGFRAGERIYSEEVQKYFKEHAREETPGKELVLMTHNPQFLNFYTGIAAVQIPTNEPVENVMKIIRKYKCDYLVLTGTLPGVFAKLYLGEESFPQFQLVYEKTIPGGTGIEGAGSQFKIYRIQDQS